MDPGLDVSSLAEWNINSKLKQGGWGVFAALDGKSGIETAALSKLTPIPLG